MLLYALAAPVWVGHGRVHRPRLCRDPAREREPAPRLDDARLRDRAGRRHAGADPDGRGDDRSARRVSSAERC